MPTRNVSLTAEQDAFVEEMVRSGRYRDASEVVGDALCMLQQRLRTEELKLGLLRAGVQAGIDAVERGAAAEIDEDELEAMLDNPNWSPRTPSGLSE